MAAVEPAKAGTGADTKRARARSKRAVPSRAELEAAVAEAVRALVGADVAPDALLAAQGLDSLAAMELRHKLQVHACPTCQAGAYAS